MTVVEFPEMRREVLSALACLADVDYQRRAWLSGVATPGRFDNLTLVVNILFDDTTVLPDPAMSVGSVLLPGDEIEALEQLSVPFGRLISRLGEASDAEYTDAPEWADVARLSCRALAAMIRAEI